MRSVLIVLGLLAAGCAGVETVPCKIDGRPCVQLRECTKCRQCRGSADKCCCQHWDKCTCIEPATGLACCGK